MKWGNMKIIQMIVMIWQEENGEEISKKLPQLELHNYYCHRLKYAITELKIKEQ